MKLNIGAKRPVEGDLVWAAGRFLNSDPSFVLLYNDSKTSIPTRFPRRKLQGVEPEAVVEALGGNSTFGRLDVPHWGTAWIRRSMVLCVEPMPAAHTRLSRYDFGANVLMRFKPPLQQHPFLPPDTPYGFGAHGLSVEEVRDALGV